MAFSTLHKGSWEGRQLLLPGTVLRSTTPVIEADKPYHGFYGWHWWISSFSAGTEQAAEIPYHFALGFGGQYIIVVPSCELVVVITADKNTKKKNPPVDVFREYIVPLLVKSYIPN
ncbi:hypothetical protein [Paenibacillus sp. BR2-3]|uniref:hypothetical protein n=1 Tax=Paenibacillus sp. BR2-3 TaxID=3048494 RepID=UPI003977E32F